MSAVSITTTLDGADNLITAPTSRMSKHLRLQCSATFNSEVIEINQPALDVIDETEVFTGLLDLDDVHEAGGELGIGPNLAVDL